MSFDKRLDRFAVLVVLAAMAVSRPLLDLLGENAEFFLARRSPTTDIVVVGLILGLAVPLVVGLLTLLGGRIGRWVFVTVAVVLSSVLLRLFLALTPAPDWLVTISATVGGVATVWALSRFPNARQVARFLLPVPLLFTVLFFVSTPTAALLSGGGTLGEAGQAERPAPLVWIVFDEMPAASLMDATGEVHAERYPNFGRLAQDGVWFSNAVTVEQQTEHSVPAILTGVKPDQSLSPFAGQYPDNIFTALAESHDLAVYETLTHLCPVSLCNDGEVSAPAEIRAELLATDISIVAGHTLLPDFLSNDLPAINQGWGYFGEEVTDFDPIAEFWEAFDLDPRRPLEQVAARIDEGFDGRPPFLFAHALVPHHPWQLLPTGQRYPLTGQRTPGTTSTGWADNPWLIDQGLQRHLLNVGYADYALGKILAALDQRGLYEDAMIVVVADHGIAIRENVEHQRHLTSDTVGEIAAVPILIKAPGVEGGRVDHRRALTIDIVPTVADVMDVELAWEPEGRSLFERDPARTTSITDSPEGAVSYGTDGSEVLAVAERLAEIFPDPNLFALRPPGSPSLIGDEVDTSALSDSGLSFSLTHSEVYEMVEPSEDAVPVWVLGRLIGTVDEGEIFAVVVNGKVAALTESYLEKRLVYVQAIVPPDALRAGPNDIEVVRLNGNELEAVTSVR